MDLRGPFAADPPKALHDAADSSIVVAPALAWMDGRRTFGDRRVFWSRAQYRDGKVHIDNTDEFRFDRPGYGARMMFHGLLHSAGVKTTLPSMSA